MKKLIQELRELPDEARHHEFKIVDTWYDIWFTFDRRYKSETGGEPDERITSYERNEIEIHKIVCFKEGGEELLPDWDLACQIQELYNQ
jgi:hypothetical protein